MTSRRAVLAGLGAVGATGLAGCAGLPFGDDEDDEREDVSLPSDAVEPVEWPESPFPVAVPAALAEAHRDQAEDLLADVPAEPSVPNGAVAEELRSDRERAADRLDDAVDDPWPTDELSEWRTRLESAATVRGAYRAATGEDDAATVTERRRGVREDLGSFVAGHEYRASSAREAVLAHAPVEDLLARCRRRSRPEQGYPAEPIADPFGAGDAVGRVELARATLADARRVREAYLSERPDASVRWESLIDASNRLRTAIARSRSSIRGYLDATEPPFDADLEGTAGRRLFDVAGRQVELRADRHGESRSDGAVATAVIEAGQALAAIEALQATAEGLRNDAYQDDVTVESVTRTADRAREAVQGIEESSEPRLAARVARPALGIFEYVPRRVEEGYADAARVQGELAWVELYARAVPAATEFVVDRL